jgi:hypothetical protein
MFNDALWCTLYGNFSHIKDTVVSYLLTNRLLDSLDGLCPMALTSLRSLLDRLCAVERWDWT